MEIKQFGCMVELATIDRYYCTLCLQPFVIVLDLILSDACHWMIIIKYLCKLKSNTIWLPDRGGHYWQVLLYSTFTVLCDCPWPYSLRCLPLNDYHQIFVQMEIKPFGCLIELATIDRYYCTLLFQRFATVPDLILSDTCYWIIIIKYLCNLKLNTIWLPDRGGHYWPILLYSSFTALWDCAWPYSLRRLLLNDCHQIFVQTEIKHNLVAW